METGQWGTHEGSARPPHSNLASSSTRDMGSQSFIWQGSVRAGRGRCNLCFCKPPDDSEGKVAPKSIPCPAPSGSPAGACQGQQILSPRFPNVLWGPEHDIECSVIWAWHLQILLSQDRTP